MKKKNPMSCFDDDIGDDFLGAWKPSNMNSVPNIDFECSQLNAPEKSFKLSENFDLDMPDFGTGLNSKLSSFDIDLDFLKSPKHSDSAKDNRGEARMTHSQTSSDALQASPGHDGSSLPGRERDDVKQSLHAEENSSMKVHDQVDAKITCKAAYSGETVAWGSQTEMAKTSVDSRDKRVLKETGKDTTKGTTHEYSSFSASFEGAIQLAFSQELLDTARETNEQPREGAVGHKNASTLSAKDQQEQVLLRAQAVSKEKNTFSGEIVCDKNAEEVTLKQIETNAERRSFQGMLQGVTKEPSLELQSPAEEVTPKHIGTKSERRNSRGTVQGVTKEQSLELQSVGLATNGEGITMHTDLQPHRYKNLGKSFAMVPEIQDEKEQTGQTDKEPWKDIAAGQVTKTSAAEHTQELKTSSMLTKGLNKVDVLNSSCSPRGAKLKSTAPKHSLSKAFLSLKPTQVSALRTSRSHALPPLRFEKPIGDPAPTADDEELQSKLKAHVNAETRSSLQTSRPLTRTTLSKKRGPPPIEQSTDHTQASADVTERSVNEAPEKRPKLQAAHRTEQESNEYNLVNAGQGKMIKTPIPGIEKLNISKHTPQAASHSQSRRPSSLSRLTSLTRSQQKHSGPTSAARIELPRPEDTFVATNSSCVIPSSFTHGQAVDPATAEIVKKTASEMNHKPESIYHGLKKPKNIVSHSLLKKSRDNLTDAMIEKCEDMENTEYHKIEKKTGSHPPLKDSRGGRADSEMHEEAECSKANVKVPCPQLLLEDIMQGQTSAKEITRDSRSMSKTTAYYSVELDKIMSTLKQKQRRAYDLLAEKMAHNAKMKYLLDSKNQEKKSMAERLEEVKLQAAGNRAKKCEWCEEHREDEAAALIKKRCNSAN